MKRNFVVLIIAVNVLILAFGGFLAYSDLYIREYSTRTHNDTAVIDVEYLPLAYRPLYEYQEYRNGEPTSVVSEGSWTLDCFQLSIILVVIGDLAWHLSMNRTKTTDERVYSW